MYSLPFFAILFLLRMKESAEAASDSILSMAIDGDVMAFLFLLLPMQLLVLTLQTGSLNASNQLMFRCQDDASKMSADEVMDVRL